MEQILFKLMGLMIVSGLSIAGCQHPPKTDTSLEATQDPARQLTAEPEYKFQVINQVEVADRIPAHSWGRLALGTQGQVVIALRDVSKLWILTPEQSELSKPLDIMGAALFFREGVEVDMGHISGFQNGMLLQGMVTENNETATLLTKINFEGEANDKLRVDMRWAQEGTRKIPLSQMQPEGIIRHWVNRLLVTPDEEIYLWGQWEKNEKIGLAEATVTAIGEALSPGLTLDPTRRSHFFSRFDSQGQFQSSHAVLDPDISDVMSHEDYFYLWAKGATSRPNIFLVKYQPEQQREIRRETLDMDGLLGGLSSGKTSTTSSWIKWVGQTAQMGYGALYYYTQQGTLPAMNLVKVDLSTLQVLWSYPVVLPELERTLDVVYHAEQRTLYILGLKKEIIETPGKVFGGLWPNKEEVFKAIVYIYSIAVP